LIALYFGTAGLGVWSIYLSFTEMIQGASTLGLDKSGVKQISENYEDIYKRDLTIQVLRYTLGIFSLVFSVIAAIFSEEFSINMFGTEQYQMGVIICCVIVCINTITASYFSILNGLREIKKLALAQFAGFFIGNLFVFSLIPFFDISYFPYYLLINAICAFAPTIFIYKKLNLKLNKVLITEAFTNLSILMKLGFAFWAAALFMTVVTYAINIYLKDHFSMEIVGIYQASWTISNLYIGIILSSMGVSFFPNICRIINDHTASNKLINEQIEFGLLVSLPFILGIFIFAPLCLSILYSSDFEAGSSIIRWQMLGVMLRLFGFPFGYALMAKSKALKYTVAQFIFHAFNFLLLIFFTIKFGFSGIGVNYFFAYIIYTLIVGIFCFKETRYVPSSFLITIVAVSFFMFFLSYLALISFDGIILYVISVGILLSSFIYSYCLLITKLNVDVNGFIKRKLKI
jgi:PST family polysaccharide transporter